MGYTTESVISTKAKPFSPERTAEVVEEFNQAGYCYFEDVFNEEETAALQEAMERKFQDPRMHEDVDGDHIRGTSMMRMYEYDQNFRDIIAREPFASLAEAILGDDCHMMSQNSIRYEPGQGGGWHVDDRIFFPLPDSISRHNPEIPLPCFIFNLLFPLSRADSVEYGCTEVVPGSHYSGRQPNDRENPSFEDRKPVSLLGKPGDAYIFNNQVWHQGAKNTSDQIRYVGSVVYSQRVIAQRLYPFIDYKVPEHVWEGMDERFERFMGRHAKGAYG